MRAFRIAGRSLVVIGAAMDAYSIVASPTPGLEVSRVTGGWAGAVGGAKVLGAGGAWVGTAVAPGLGTAVGAIVGGAVGGALGYWGGETFAQWIYNSIQGD